MARRTTKKERKENARNFYSILMNGNCNKTAIVVRRIDSTTGYCKCQFLSVISNVAWGNATIIAESMFGVEGCFKELLSNIRPDVEQKSYYDDDFNSWLEEKYKFHISYKDGLVYMLERVQESEVE